MIIDDICHGVIRPDINRKALTYIYIEGSIRNEFTEIVREQIRKNGGKVTIGVKHDELNEEERRELSRMREELRDKRIYAEELYKEQRRAVIEYLCAYPGASYSEMAKDLALSNEMKFARIIGRLGKKLACHIQE
ncbi:hypothetical protein [Laceyella putida]